MHRQGINQTEARILRAANSINAQNKILVVFSESLVPRTIPNFEVSEAPIKRHKIKGILITPIVQAGNKAFAGGDMLPNFKSPIKLPTTIVLLE